MGKVPSIAPSTGTPADTEIPFGVSLHLIPESDLCEEKQETNRPVSPIGETPERLRRFRRLANPAYSTPKRSVTPRAANKSDSIENQQNHNPTQLYSQMNYEFTLSIFPQKHRRGEVGQVLKR